MIGGGSETQLPGRRWIVIADAAAAAHAVVKGAKSQAPVPHLFGNISPAGTGGRQSGSAHLRDVGTAGREAEPERTVHLAGKKRIAVARGVEERLALHRHLLENLLAGGVRTTSPAPGTTDLARGVVHRNLVQHDVRDKIKRIAFIHHHLIQAWGHGNDHFNVERDFHLAAGASGNAGETVEQNVGQGNGREAGLLRIQGDVAGQITVKLNKGDFLSGAGQRGAGNIGRAEVVAHVIATRPGAGAGLERRRRVRGVEPQFGMRAGIVVQPADVRNRQRGRHGRLGVRGKKRASFRRVLVGVQGDIEGLLDIGSLGVDFDQHPVGVRGRDRETIGLREADHRLVILRRGAELRGEFRRREVAVVIGAGRVIHLLEQRIQRGLIAQRQTDGQMQRVGCANPAGGRQLRHHRRHMAG